MDDRFSPPGGPWILYILYHIQRRHVWLQVLAAATSASWRQRFLSPFCAPFCLVGLTADLSSLVWQGFNFQTARATLGPFTGGDEEQTSCTAPLWPAVSQS